MIENGIIDVDFKEVIDLEEKTTEELKIEANNLYNQMEAIGNVGLMLAVQAGQRLITIKERLPHGEFEEWCKNNLQFSKRKAENMMKLSLKMDEENSLFSKTQTFTDLGISKVWELLAAPEEVAKEVMNNPDATEMSVKEFKKEIDRLKKEINTMGEQRDSEQLGHINQKIIWKDKIEKLEAELENNKQGSPEEVVEKEKEIAALEEKLNKAKDDLKNKAQAEKEKLLNEQKELIEEAIKKAEDEAKKQLEEEMSDIRKNNIEAATEIDRLKHKLDNASNAEIAIYKVKADQLQQDFNSCLVTTEAVRIKDKDQATKMKGALLQIIKIMEGQLE